MTWCFDVSNHELTYLIIKNNIENIVYNDQHDMPVRFRPNDPRKLTLLCDGFVEFKVSMACLNVYDYVIVKVIVFCLQARDRNQYVYFIEISDLNDSFLPIHSLC